MAIFKKTVAMHEVFLCRVAAHPILRKDLNFHVFLEYNQDVSTGIHHKNHLRLFRKQYIHNIEKL